MRRRDFITVIAGSAAAWPLAARAQHANKLPIIGFLGASTASANGPWVIAFVQRLHDLGWIAERTVAIEYRWAELHDERAAAFAAEFVQLKVDVIVTTGSLTAVAARQATSSIPIVFTAVGDPITIGLVASLARPGGNATGLSMQQTDTASKRLELLREVVPSVRHLAIMANTRNPSAALEMREARKAASVISLEVITLEIRKAEDIAPAFEALKGRTEALYVCTDPIVYANQVRINILALGARLPTMHGVHEYVQTGGLMSYGPNFPDLFRRAAEYADKILRGVKPGDIPVEQPTKFDFVINVTTAKALGITVPPTILARADEVIE